MGLFSLFSKKKIEELENIVKQQADFSSFNRVTDYIYEKSGITDLDTRALAASRMQQYAMNQNIYTSAEFLTMMKENTSFYQEVMNIATVNETFFMREVKELEWLVEYIQSTHKKLKILSMPSSSGEEIYSILIMLGERGISLDKVEMYGYDINSQAIKNAKDGQYEEHSLHKLDSNLRMKHFSQEGDIYKISSSIQMHTHFEQNNIFEVDARKHNFDVVLSRNMFIYFDDEKRKRALNIIIELLNPNGIYIKGHADHIAKHNNLEKICYGIYKKV